ncbi:cupin domain-containing protein [Paenibacillus sp. D51F]
MKLGPEHRPSVRTFAFHDDGSIPNHPSLHVLFYPSAVSEPGRMELLFASNGWGNTWTNGVFSYHHYHSNAHEALGVARGSAKLQLGGEQGEIVEMEAGDVLVLPAGTGHKKLQASADFLISGGYPGGIDYNIRTGEPGERPRVLEEIRLVPMPASDPVYGKEGPLLTLWNNNQGAR